MRNCQVCYGNGIIEKIQDNGESLWITCKACDGNNRLPDANDQQPSLEELGPEYDYWLDDVAQFEAMERQEPSVHRLPDDWLRAMAVDENGNI